MPSMTAISLMRSTPSAVSISGMTRTLLFEWSRCRGQPSTDQRAPSTVGHMPRPPDWYRDAARARRASSALDTLGTTTPSAPESSARWMWIGSLVGTRTIGTTSCILAARMCCSVDWTSLGLCSWSMMTKSAPAHANAAVTAASRELTKVPTGAMFCANIVPKRSRAPCWNTYASSLLVTGLNSDAEIRGGRAGRRRLPMRLQHDLHRPLARLVGGHGQGLLDFVDTEGVRDEAADVDALGKQRPGEV